ncbi:MAG: glycosyltransferase family 2 protein [Bryobacteraceae bacterium]
MRLDSPLVSIVTPTLNAGRYLRESIASVLEQDYPNIEYLVVDSHSTDDTTDILKEYAGRIRVIQAERRGAASAIHTGLSEAHGSIVAWLSADDKYLPGAVSNAVAVLQRNSETDVVYGDANWIDESGGIIRRYPTISFDPRALAHDCFISQPATFFRAEAYRACALDQSLLVSFDYDLWIRLSALGRRFTYVPQQLACSRMHRECLTLAYRQQVFEVTMGLLKRHHGYIPIPWILSYLSYRHDGRDQFFEPLRFSPWVLSETILFGVLWNRARPLQAIRDSTAMVADGVRRRLAGFARNLGIGRSSTPALFSERSEPACRDSDALNPSIKIAQ